MNENKTIAFFDFDGTITNRDIFWDYLFYRLKNGLSPLKLIYGFPVFALYLIKVLNNEKAKQLIFSRLFKAESVNYFERTVQQYYQSNFKNKLRKDATAKILWHKNSRHQVYIVSANFNLIIQYFAAEQGIKYISTELDIQNNVITGKFKTPNCYGAEKVNRIKQAVPDLKSYTKIYAYGDSKGDREMLAFATDPYYRCFKN
ncbi:MAG: haloacid dehalogenase-like hydrolase [Sphingobacteriaceae bacterium]|nr:MAG: haloacid dehalogenase-like hydrolase [Sphingobacteriaceae bacterium]